MKIKTIMLFPTILITLTLFFIGCSDLSRGEAKDILLGETDADWHFIYLVPSFNNGLNGYHFVYNNNHKKIEQKLVMNGFIKYKMNYLGVDYYGFTDKILPLKKLKQKRRKEV